ncbi:DUF4386 domain-containing protein [Blastococcus saxobsidens]|uniref:Uncharacterized protein DUF4386 n=1 Tax=Blastococcus saxobsidens TaxID=138336 RepID=A0A4Q7YB76_9ACTN|nr:DUF4386 domain-containing protein [Blastococcus saxobsidens]RZU33683.1 uncharacterized protein DUF4386 [Blastococcus saxobsidens]
MGSTRRTAMVAGVFFLVAAAASIPALGLFQPVLGDARYVLGAGADGQVLLGALLEIVTVAAVMGTGIALYPVLRREHHAAALGYALGRLMEGALIAVGLVAVLVVVTLREDASGADDGALLVVQEALVAVKDWTFLLGPNVALGLNTLLLAGIMHRSGLVPRWIATLGLVGGPLILASGVAVLLGRYEQVSVVGALAALPVFAWEMSLAVHLLARGFRSSPRALVPPSGTAAPVPV